MCLGSLAFPRIVSPARHPLRAYAALELGIGVLGILILIAMPTVSGLYVAGLDRGIPGILLRGAVCGACLVPPTVLMGATLPAIARWVEDSPGGISWLGFFYGGNIAGAVLGCLLAGFYLLRVHDLATATFAAAGLNGAVGIASLALAARAAHRPRPAASEGTLPAGRPGLVAIHGAIALSGLSALGAEVVWTRLLSLILGGTVYTFSLILAVFLAGLGIGSAAGAHLSRKIERPRVALGWCQMLLAGAIAWSAFMIARSIPYWPVNPTLSTSPWFTFQVDLARCIPAVLPAACLWGASFPLALAAAAGRGSDAGRIVGRIYAANTLGAIAGALAFTLAVIPLYGTTGAERILIGTSVAAAVLLLLPGAWRGGRGNADRPRQFRIVPAAVLLVSVAAAGWLAREVRPIPAGVIGYGRYFPTYSKMPDFLYVGEGLSSSVAVSELASGVRNFHVSGKIEASTEVQDMRLQHMLGNLPALLHPEPRSVLVVGFGAGVTAGSFVPYPGIGRIVICEIEPLIPRVVSLYFEGENHAVLDDPRVQVVHDDARHFLLATREKFDIITSDPIHPWVKGAATLYTEEYFGLVKAHLEPGGMVTQWVPLYESDAATVKSEMATFFRVFPGGTVWGNDTGGEGYDTVLLGGPGDLRIDPAAIEGRLGEADHAGVAESLREGGLFSLLGLLQTYAGRARDLAPWLEDGQINRDRDLRLQYLAGFGSNLGRESEIYREILKHRKFPDELFVLTPEMRKAYRKAMGMPPEVP